MYKLTAIRYTDGCGGIEMIRPKSTTTRTRTTTTNTRLMAIFQDNLAKLVLECHHCGFYWSKDGGGARDNWSCKTCKAPVKSSPPTSQNPTVYRLDAVRYFYNTLFHPQRTVHIKKIRHNRLRKQKFTANSSISITDFKILTERILDTITTQRHFRKKTHHI